jgi:hypothetical protein
MSATGLNIRRRVKSTVSLGALVPASTPDHPLSQGHDCQIRQRRRFNVAATQPVASA